MLYGKPNPKSLPKNRPISKDGPRGLRDDDPQIYRDREVLDRAAEIAEIYRRSGYDY